MNLWFNRVFWLKTWNNWQWKFIFKNFEIDSFETYLHYFNILRELETLAGFVLFSSRLNPWLLRPIKIMETKDYIDFEVAWYDSIDFIKIRGIRPNKSH